MYVCIKMYVLNVSKKMAKKVLKNPSRAIDITANIATAAASRNTKNVMKVNLYKISLIY